MQKRTRKLDAAAAAYIAGLIDGEGTVTLTRVHRNENRRLVVSISNNELTLLEFVLREFGVGKITRKRVSKATHSPSYTYQVSNRQAIELLKQILPYLRSYKRDRAAMAVQSYVELTPRNGRYSVRQLSARQSFEKDLMAIKPAHYPLNAGAAVLAR